MASKRRIMLVKLVPRRPLDRVFATLNPTDKGANIALSSGNLVAANASATTHKVRATQAIGRGSWYWETSVTAGTNAANRTGIARGTVSLTSAPALGTGLLNAGVEYSTGNCYYKGSTVATIGAAGAGNIVCHWFNAEDNRYRVRRNNDPWKTIVSGLGDAPWYPVVEVPQSNGQRANFGASSFSYVPPAGVNAGVWHVPAAVPNPVYVSSEGYVGGVDGKSNPIVWRPRIAGDSDVIVDRAAITWLFDGQGISRRGTLTILNGDYVLNAWLSWEWRDAEYQIFSGYEGMAFEDFELWAQGVVDDLMLDGTRRFVLPLTDPLARLDKPLQTTVYPTTATNAQIVGSSLPVAIGQPLYCPGVLRSTAIIGVDAFSYDFHDDALRALSAVYDRGDVLTVTTDYDQLPKRTGVKLVNEPDRPVCANVIGATEKVSTLIPVSGIASDFVAATWAGSPSQPPGWAISVAGTGTVTKVSAGARFHAPTGGDQAELVTVSSVIPLNALVRVDIEVGAYVSGALNVRRGIAAIFGAPIINAVGRWTLFGQNSSANALRLYVTSVADITIRSVTLTEVVVIERLPAWMKYLCVTRGGLDVSVLDTAAINALDTVAPYRLAHYTDKPESILSILRRTLDSWCGWVCSNRLGQVTVGRLEARAGRTGALKINGSKILSIQRRQDTASGFTRRLAGRRNHKPHNASEIASGVGAALRAELMAEWTCIRSAAPAADAGLLATEPLSSSAIFSGQERAAGSAYQHADGNEPQPTLLQEPTQIQSEINRVDALLASTAIRWFEVDAALSAAAADAIELGQFVHVQHPIEGLEDGRWLVVMRAVVRFHGRRVTLTLLDLPETA